MVVFDLSVQLYVHPQDLSILSKTPLSRANTDHKQI